jgi:hypothetical protein
MTPESDTPLADEGTGAIPNDMPTGMPAGAPESDPLGAPESDPDGEGEPRRGDEEMPGIPSEGDPPAAS